MRGVQNFHTELVEISLIPTLCVHKALIFSGSRASSLIMFSLLYLKGFLIAQETNLVAFGGTGKLGTLMKIYNVDSVSSNMKVP